MAAWLLGFASAHTRRSYAGDLTGWLSFCRQHDVDPTQARRPHIDAWAERWKQPGSSRGRWPGGWLAVSSWYGFLVDEQVRPTSPAEHVRRPKAGDRGGTPGLTRDELRPPIQILRRAARHASRQMV